MIRRTNLTYKALFFVTVSSLCVMIAAHSHAQGRPAAPPAGPPGQLVPPPVMKPRASAPIDLTGYWVSIVTEDWRFRMTVPDKGDYASVPLNPQGRQVASAWDPAKDQAEGTQCKSYGAAAIMRVPGRIHIYWENDDTLRIDTDSGRQTRLLHFGSPSPSAQEATWQGYSVADWEGARPVSFFMPALNRGPKQPSEGYLKVITTHMRSGYLRKNGVPYSANAVLEEYLDTFKEMNGDQWLVVTTIVTDPMYLFQPFITSTHFKKLSSNSGWDPTECHADQPR
jgi:hypothetical protein